MSDYLSRRATELAKEDAEYNRWYASLSYLEKQNFEAKMKQIMTHQEWKANPPKIKLKPEHILLQDNEMLQMVCLGKISVKQYITYRQPKNDKHIEIICKEIDERYKQLTGKD